MGEEILIERHIPPEDQRSVQKKQRQRRRQQHPSHLRNLLKQIKTTYQIITTTLTWILIVTPLRFQTGSHLFLKRRQRKQEQVTALVLMKRQGKVTCLTC